MDKQQMKAQLRKDLEIEQAHDGVRLVTLNGAVLGRLGRTADGRWELDWRAGWTRQSGEWVGSGEVEHAEKWAVAEIAELLAMERSAIDAGKPWGDSPPPGVT